MKKLCVNCRNLFDTARNVPHQSYCSDERCQKARKLAWISNKLEMDQDYKSNQRKAQKSWQQANPGYWKKYRQQDQSDTSVLTPSKSTKPKKSPVLKPTVSEAIGLNGLFELRVLSQIRRVKIDVYIVEIRRHQASSPSKKIAKR